MLLLHDIMLNCSHDKDASRVLISNEIALWHNALFVSWNKGPTQVKYGLLISSIFDAINFQHFQKMQISIPEPTLFVSKGEIICKSISKMSQ